MKGIINIFAAINASLLAATILVTGGTGFLGSYIIRDLVKKNYSVRALRRSSNIPSWINADNFKNVEWVEGDILDVVSLDDAMEGIDTIIHSAAVVSFGSKDRKEMYQVNVDGTANVVNMALEKNVRRLIHISSVAALGRTAGGGHVNETKIWEESKVNTHYAISKHKGELHVWRGIAEGLEAVILNPSTILGYGDWDHGSCSIFKKVNDGFNWYTPGINGFVDVEDVAKVTCLFVENDKSEERYIVNGDTWSFKKLQDTIAAGFEKKGPTRKTSPFILAIAWRLEKLKSHFTGKKPLLTKESIRVANSKTWFENDKILATIPGFQFTPLEQTIASACVKYRILAKNESGVNPPMISE